MSKKLKKAKDKNILPAVILLLLSVCITVLLTLSSGTGIMKNIELRTLDYRFIARGKKVPASKDIVIIAMDNKSFAAIKEPFFQWPQFITEVSEKLVKNGVKVIGIDVIQGVSLEKFHKGQTKRMMKVLLSDKVILISAINLEGGITYPIPQLVAIKGKGIFGPANVTPDVDNIIRRQAMHFNNPEAENPNEGQLPAFPIKVVEKFLDGSFEGNGKQYQIGNHAIKDEKGYIRINFAGPPNTVKMYSFSDVLEQAGNNNDQYFTDNFKDKIVLIGRTNTAGKDLFDVPYNVTTGKLMSGIEIHANTINTILQGRYFKSAGSWTTFFIVLIFCLITAFVSYYKKPGFSLTLCFGIILAYIFVSFVLFINFDYITNIITPVLAIPLVFGSTFVYRYHTVDKRMRYIRDTFGKLVSRDVEEELWAEKLHPEPGRGTRRKITVLFSDINDFTPRCEKRSAQEIMEMLNEYFTKMVEVVFDNRGTVKQFVGDEIMVMFGAPHQQPHQAILAVRTAADMLLALREMKKSNKPGFYEVKIGIHTGEVTVGFLGSIQRMQYTAIGENVNLAARIEALNKQLDTNILISEDTYKELMTEHEELKNWLDDIELIDRGKQSMKGFKREFTVYEVKLKED